MKSTLTVICLLALALFVMSCGDSNTDAQSETENAAAENPTEHPPGSEHPTEHPTGSEHPTASDGLTLNDSKKWQMDDHTRAVFAKMAASFVATDVSALDPAGLKAVGAGLKVNVNELIQGCTMTGPDHDQLHVYLSGYIPAVSALEENGKVADAKKVQHYLAIYGDYFE
jgi:hypothetical protein